MSAPTHLLTPAMSGLLDRIRRADRVRGMTHDFIKRGRVLKEAGAAQPFAADALIDAWSQPK